MDMESKGELVRYFIITFCQEIWYTENHCVLFVVIHRLLFMVLCTPLQGIRLTEYL